MKLEHQHNFNIVCIGTVRCECGAVRCFACYRPAEWWVHEKGREIAEPMCNMHTYPVFRLDYIHCITAIFIHPRDSMTLTDEKP